MKHYKIVGTWEFFLGEWVWCFIAYIIDDGVDYDVWWFFEKIVIKRRYYVI